MIKTDINKNFVEELDKIVQDYYKNVLQPALKDLLLKNIKLLIPNDKIKPLLEKYNINKYIQIGLSLNASYYEPDKILVYYKDIEVKAKDDYISLPVRAKEPQLLDTIKECIIQDTNNPNVTKLEQ